MVINLLRSMLRSYSARCAIMLALLLSSGICGVANAQHASRVARFLGPDTRESADEFDQLQWGGTRQKPVGDKQQPLSDRKSAARPNSLDPRLSDPNRGRSESHSQPSPMVTGDFDRRKTSLPSWQGELIANDDLTPGAPAYIVIDRDRKRQRYIRSHSDVDLDRFVGRSVNVLQDTGLVLGLEQVELLERDYGRAESESLDYEFASHVSHDSDPRSVSHGLLRRATYDEEPPRFRPVPRSGRREASPVRESATSPGRQRDVFDDDRRVAQQGPFPPRQSLQGPLIVDGYGQNVVVPQVPGPVLPGGPGCASCGQRPITGCAPGARGRWWGRAEYLWWWTDGFYIPRLVTSSTAGVPQTDAGVLGLPTTSVRLGNREILDDTFNGARFRLGRWIGSGNIIGLEGDYLGLDQESFNYSATGHNGTPILGRPFFNMLTGQQDAELVSFPNVIEGTVAVDAASDLESIGMRLRYALCCRENCNGLSTTRLDLLVGYRYAQLDEQLRITENLSSLVTTNPGNFRLRDEFLTHNEFHGADVGIVWDWEQPRWSLELASRVALGTTEQDVFIRGTTTVSDNGFQLVQPGGLLAQRTNIGHYERNEFSVIPELSATLAYRVTPRLRIVAGYTFMYWSRVVRPGDQIDLDVNPNLLPPEAVPFDGPLRPRFVFRDTDYWAQGLSVGIDYRL